LVSGKQGGVKEMIRMRIDSLEIERKIWQRVRNWDLDEREESTKGFKKGNLIFLGTGTNISREFKERD
jgi:hypothetical protein